MRIILICCVFFVMQTTVLAQDTLYFASGGVVCDKTIALYYSVVVRSEGGFYAESYALKNNFLLMTGTYQDKECTMMNGYFHIYNNKKGHLDSEGYFLQNKKQGKWKRYYADTARVWRSEMYQDDKLNGDVKTYFRNGKLKRFEQYDEGSFSGGQCFGVSGQDTAFYLFEEKAVFPGGELELNKFISADRIYYPLNYGIKAGERTVNVFFFINEKGKADNIEVIGADDAPSIIADAKEILNTMPAWKPAKREGVIVPEYHSWAIHYSAKYQTKFMHRNHYE